MKYLVLFASSATLLCCALPALLVFLGFGAVVASLVSNLPFLITLSEHKVIVFSVSALIIIISWILSFRKTSCPIDQQKEDCQTLKIFSNRINIISSILWCVGFIVAVIVPKLMLYFSN